MQMKLKMNKACDLNSISVLPPHSRRRLPTGMEPSSLGNSQPSASQLRSQLSQQSFSQGASSQQGLFSQFSQNSLDDVLVNEQRLASQDMESSAKRVHCLPPVNHLRDENQLQITRSTSNAMRKWSPPEYKCQINEELQHRFGMMETSLSRVGMILDSVQKDVMQVHKGTKEVTLEIESVRQKIIVLDDLLQLTRKGQEDVKASFEGSLKSLLEQFKQNILQEITREISTMLSNLPEKVETGILKSRNDLVKTLTKELQAIFCSLKDSNQKKATQTVHQPKGIIHHVPNHERKSPKSTLLYEQKIRHAHLNFYAICSSADLKVAFNKPKVANIPLDTAHTNAFALLTASKIGKQLKIEHQVAFLWCSSRLVPVYRVASGPFPSLVRAVSLAPKLEMGAWKSVNHKQATSKERNADKCPRQKGVSPIPLEQKRRVTPESDEDIDGGFSCLFSGKEKADYTIEDARQETERILKKARRRKRKNCNPIIID